MGHPRNNYDTSVEQIRKGPPPTATPTSKWKPLLDAMLPGDWVVYPVEASGTLNGARCKHAKKGEFSILANPEDATQVIFLCNKKHGSKTNEYA